MAFPQIIRRYGRPLLFAVVAATTVGIGGCSPSRSHARPIHAYVGIDTSAGTRSRLGAFAALAARLGSGRLEPGRDHLTLFTICDSTREFSDGPAPESQPVLEQTIVQAVKIPPAHSATLPALFWSEVARRVSADATSRVIIVLLSDGDNDEITAESRSAIQAAGRRLAACANVVSVAVIGVNPENRAYLRACFAPLGDRFLLQGPTEMDTDAVLRHLENGPH
jgi:hypothetical protein